MKCCLPCAVLLAGAIGLFSRPARALDPTTADCLRASDASFKLGNDHKLRAERAQLLVCAHPSCPADIRKECARRVEDLNVQIPTIIFQAKDASGKDISAVNVTMDGEELAERLEGISISIDPGSHTFVFQTEGQPKLQEQLLIQEAEKDRRERIAFGVTAGAGMPRATDPGGTAMLSTPERPPPSSSAGLGAQRIAAIIAGSAGIVGLGLGSAFGVMAISKRNLAHDVCPDVCPQYGADDWSDAKRAGDASTVAFIAGGVALVGGAALWFTAGKPEAGGAPRAQVGLGLGTLQIKSTW